MSNPTEFPRRTAGWLSAVAAAALVAGIGFGVPAGPASAELLSMDKPIQVIPSFADVVERVKPAVVSVRVRSQGVAQADLRGDERPNRRSDNFNRGPGRGQPERPGPQQFGMPDLAPDHPLYDFFRRFEDRGPGGPGAPGPRQQPRRGMSQGSGFFISGDGYIVTNNHVIDNAANVEVVMDDGRTLDAKVVGTDPRTDLALLKVEGNESFPHVRLAPERSRIGDWVVAIGNPFGLGGTVTAGIVSAEARDIGAGPYDEFMQIDAPINRGNSGGPTFNLSGEVVGVNTAIFSPSGGNVGIAFAIPAHVTQQVVQQLREKGEVTRGFLGVQVQPVTKEIAEAIGLEEARGALIAQPQDDSPAAKAGLLTGDVILAVDGNTVKDHRELTRMIAAIAPGTNVPVTILRKGEERVVDVEIGRLSGA